MYAVGGSQHPTIISEGNRYIAPELDYAKEGRRSRTVTPRLKRSRPRTAQVENENFATSIYYVRHDLVFNIRTVAVRLDLSFSISDRLEDATQTASDGFKRIDREFGVGQRWRIFSTDFRRNLPGYRRQLKEFHEKLGKSSAVRTLLTLKFISLFDFVSVSRKLCNSLAS
ncbi:Pectate lyase [Nymphaea thermarum]|nr:Pectate lyase [Nymphaea thermarum]